MVGMDKTVTLYQKNQQWKAIYLSGVSVTHGQNRKLIESRDKSKGHRVDQGVQLQKWADVKIPKEALPGNAMIEVGDLLLLGNGPQKVNSSSQLKKDGWSCFVVQQVEDRLEEPVLPHLALKCC